MCTYCDCLCLNKPILLYHMMKERICIVTFAPLSLLVNNGLSLSLDCYCRFSWTRGRSYSFLIMHHPVLQIFLTWRRLEEISKEVAREVHLRYALFGALEEVRHIIGSTSRTHGCLQLSPSGCLQSQPI